MSQQQTMESSPTKPMWNEWWQMLDKEVVQHAQRMMRVQEWSVGRQPDPKVGQTAKDVIWTKNKSKLYHYYAEGDRKYKTPILLIYALINRPYILDLHAGNSVVEYLVQQGFDVYLYDWGTFGPEDRELQFDDFIFDYIDRAVNKVMYHAKSQDISLIGYCMGGTLTAMYASLFPERIRNLVFMTAPIDFEDAGLYTNWLSAENYPLDQLVNTVGNIPAMTVDFGNKMLRPMANFVGSQVNLAERMWDDNFIDSWMYMNKWINDGTPFPGEAYRQWIRDFYQENKLTRNELYLRGRKVQLKNIACPVLNVVADRDHICHPHQAEALGKHISSKDYEFHTAQSGHVSLVVGKKAKQNFWPKLSGWLEKHSHAQK